MIRKSTFAPALLAATFAALAGSAQGADRTAIRYAPGVKMPRLEGAQLTTFVVKPEKLSLEDAVKQGGRLVDYTQAGIVVSPDQADQGDSGVIKFHDEGDASASLEMSVNRRKIVFNRGLAPYSKEESDTKGLPSDKDLLPAVQRHLEALGLLPKDEELQAPTVGGLNLAVKREDGSNSIYRKLARLRFDRTLAGLPVEGGSRVVALLGEEGSLQSLFLNWPEVEGRKVDPAELITDSDLGRSVPSRLLTDLGTAREVLVEKLDLVLFDRDGVIEPAVRIQAQATFVDPVVNGKRGEVRTNVQPYDTLVPVLRSPKATYPFEPNKEAAGLVKSDLGE
jgi:hypothetical protein